MSELNKVEVGSIFSCSWGYDQTNVDFYEVVKTTKAMVFIRELLQEVVTSDDRAGNRMIPIKGAYASDEVLRKKLQSSSYDPHYVKINSYSWASLWDGKPKYATDSLCGH